MSAAEISNLFKGELVVINMGLESFAENLKTQQVRVLQMNWRPPAGGDREMADLLKKLGR